MNKTDPSPFLDRLFLHLGEDGIDVSRYVLDHICYRVATTLEYDEMCEELSTQWRLLNETLIWGRMIATYRLDEPIRYHDREIWCVEIPSPKAWSPYPTGWEHAEFVIDMSFDEMMAKYPDISYHTDSMSKTINPDISIKYPGLSVKFHHNTLEYVIEFTE